MGNDIKEEKRVQKNDMGNDLYIEMYTTILMGNDINEEKQVQK